MRPLGYSLPIGRTLRPYREVLIENRTYYVATTGSDNNNNGLSVDAPFLTIQKAVDVISTTLDMCDKQVTITIANGTYTSGVTLKNYIGSVQPIITGNQGSPESVVVSVSGGNCFYCEQPTQWSIANLKTQASDGACVMAFGPGVCIKLSSVSFGAASNHVYALLGAYIYVSGNYTISGGAGAHLSAIACGAIRSVDTATITISGTPAFTTAFAYVTDLSRIGFSSKTFSGSPTGKRYQADNNGIINTNGGGANYFPGNASGTTATGGIYV